MTKPEIQFVIKRLESEKKHAVFTVMTAMYCYADDTGVVDVSDIELFTDMCLFDKPEELLDILGRLEARKVLVRADDPFAYYIEGWDAPYTGLSRNNGETWSERMARMRLETGQSQAPEQTPPPPPPPVRQQPQPQPQPQQTYQGRPSGQSYGEPTPEDLAAFAAEESRHTENYDYSQEMFDYEHFFSSRAKKSTNAKKEIKTEKTAETTAPENTRKAAEKPASKGSARVKSKPKPKKNQNDTETNFVSVSQSHKSRVDKTKSDKSRQEQCRQEKKRADEKTTHTQTSAPDATPATAVAGEYPDFGSGWVTSGCETPPLGLEEKRPPEKPQDHTDDTDDTKEPDKPDKNAQAGYPDDTGPPDKKTSTHQKTGTKENAFASTDKDASTREAMVTISEGLESFSDENAGRGEDAITEERSKEFESMVRGYIPTHGISAIEIEKPFTALSEYFRRQNLSGFADPKREKDALTALALRAHALGSAKTPPEIVACTMVGAFQRLINSGGYFEGMSCTPSMLLKPGNYQKVLDKLTQTLFPRGNTPGTWVREYEKLEKEAKEITEAIKDDDPQEITAVHYGRYGINPEDPLRFSKLQSAKHASGE